MIDIPTWLELQTYVIDQLKNNEFFATAGFFGIIGVLWQYTKVFPQYLWGRIERKITYTANIEETDEFYAYFELWLNQNHFKAYRNVQVTTTSNRTYNAHNKTYSAPLPPPYTEAELAEATTVKELKNEEIRYKQYQDLFFIRRGFYYIKVFKGREQLQNASSISNAFYNHFKITGFFAKNAINKMLKEVLALKQSEESLKPETTVGVWTNDGDYWQKEEDFEPKELKNIIIPEKEGIIEDIDSFLTSKQWYKDRSIPYKRGYMFHGNPGSGKTSLSLALAHHYKKDIFVLNPSGVKDDDLRQLFRGLNKNSMLLLEDVDTVFSKDRDKRDNDVKFNFSTLLNCLDGVFSKEGVITVFTTNYVGRLDSALIREGRIDYKLQVSNPTEASINQYLSLFYQKDVKINNSTDNEVISMAGVQELCLINKDDCTTVVEEINKQLNEVY